MGTLFGRFPSRGAALQCAKAFVDTDHPLLDRRKVLRVNGLKDGDGFQSTEFDKRAFKFAEYLSRSHAIMLADEFPHLHDSKLGSFDGVVECRAEIRLKPCEVCLGVGNEAWVNPDVSA